MTLEKNRVGILYYLPYQKTHTLSNLIGSRGEPVNPPRTWFKSGLLSLVTGSALGGRVHLIIPSFKWTRVAYRG